MLIKPEPAVISKSVQLPVIAETPGTVNLDPPFKPCPNVLQTRVFPQAQSAGTGGLSILASPVNSMAVGATKIAAVTDAAESRSWDSLIQLLMGNSAGESRRNSTGSLKGQSNTSGFRIPQVHEVFNNLVVGHVSILITQMTAVADKPHDIIYRG